MTMKAGIKMMRIEKTDGGGKCLVYTTQNTSNLIVYAKKAFEKAKLTIPITSSCDCRLVEASEVHLINNQMRLPIGFGTIPKLRTILNKKPGGGDFMKKQKRDKQKQKRDERCAIEASIVEVDIEAKPIEVGDLVAQQMAAVTISHRSVTQEVEVPREVLGVTNEVKELFPSGELYTLDKICKILNQYRRQVFVCDFLFAILLKIIEGDRQRHPIKEKKKRRKKN